MPDAIEVLHVCKRFGDTKALDDVSLNVATGKVLALLGPNGAGKTTLVRVLTTLLRPDSGQARVAGFDVSRDAKAIRSMIGLAGQFATVDELLTGRENLELVGLLYHLEKSEYKRRAGEALERMTLTAAGDQPVKTYSGGMRRRLDLAASLIGRPPILFLDEPTTGLDPQARHLLWDRLYRLKQDGVTLVITTHYMDEAEQLCDRLVVMDKGRFAAEGSPRQLIETYSTKEVVELRFAPGQHEEVAPSLANLAERQEVLPDRILLYTDDGDAALAEVARMGHVARATLVRRSTLEDVFLRLTGRSLVD
jgi:lipooligosaccharide transport system ATP-binding protein